MPWGAFEIKDNGMLKAIHVAPCNEQGYLTRPHMLNEICLCEPVLDQRPGCCPVWVHQGVQ